MFNNVKLMYFDLFLETMNN